MSGPRGPEIRSYREVFALERRIYRIDRCRLNPGGVPIRGIVYCVVLFAVLLMLAALPFTGWLLGLLPWYMRYLALPVGGAALFALVRVEGRAFHLAAYALVRHAFGPKALCGLASLRGPMPGARWQPPALVLLADGSEPRLHRLRFLGPGAVLVALPHVCSHKGHDRRGARTLCVRPLPSSRPLARARVLAISRGARLDVHSS